MSLTKFLGREKAAWPLLPTAEHLNPEGFGIHHPPLPDHPWIRGSNARAPDSQREILASYLSSHVSRGPDAEGSTRITPFSRRGQQKTFTHSPDSEMKNLREFTNVLGGHRTRPQTDPQISQNSFFVHWVFNEIATMSFLIFYEPRSSLPEAVE